MAPAHSVGPTGQVSTISASALPSRDTTRPTSYESAIILVYPRTLVPGVLDQGLQTPYDEGQTAVHYLRYRRTAGLVDSQIVGTAPRTTR
jgi:hypothetical protein